MRDLLPSTVAVAVAGPADWASELLPAEQACLGEQAVPTRRRDFAAGRACARRALTHLGLPPTAVPAAADRAPVWPAGVVGAITHTTGYCAAAAAHTTDIRSVGIDAELHREVNPGVRRLVLLPEEEANCARLPSGIHWPIVLFSAKETVYKVWYPIVESWLDFHDARLDLDPDAGTFTARIAQARVDAATADDAPASISGRFVVADGLVRTAAVLSLR
ncbi:4'-phosphopantetheinyl transferase family protein [Micromonospora parathelypteridis]|uniref:4'-phosphopantetheinyl transferase EntD n=1 Tax=Micromonospora parathelypteridis TaxID=1839617 RepID=A0A840W423_9ACTN|nr:4'-phosphopantetheinyl transferase superfamily protein [Micromonospora parathelypteridis]MBB5478979.1 4'-phosphopantetheinyl transferase EntD [Micromonospora parathelypteridis]GGO03651.1 putative 4'-phosphopantetheinyl transferase [Micromonospora parathelypteridis]